MSNIAQEISALIKALKDDKTSNRDKKKIKRKYDKIIAYVHKHM